MILKTLGDAGKRVNILILDACRNNPFTTRNGEAFNGLARMALARHSYMIFSTFAGAAARDGAGVNSPFADAIAAPGLDLEAAAKKIRLDVAKRTDGTQISETWSSLEDAFSFNPHPPDPAADREAAFWHSIEATTHREEYEAYLSRYPDGTFAELARQRIRDAAPARIASEWPAASFPDFWPPIGGRIARCTGEIELLPKWTTMLARYRRQRRAVEAGRRNPFHDVAAVREWRTLTALLADEPWRRQLEQVNGFVNAVAHHRDHEHWGMRDRWTTPFEFLAHGGGEEDYAIAKFITLREIGVPSPALRLLTLYDEADGIAHAVLLVAVDGEIHWLDSRRRGLTRLDEHSEFRPIFSIRESYWCRYPKAS